MHPVSRSALRLTRALLTALLLLGGGLLGGGLAAAGDGTGIPWIKDLESGLREARKSGKPIFVDAWARWCQACYQMDDVTYSRTEIIEAMEDFVPVKLDMDIYDNFSNKHRVAVLPTALFLDDQGRELTRITGLAGPEQVGPFMEQVLQEYAAYRSARSQGDDPEALHTVAKKLIRMGNPRGAVSVLQEASELLEGQPAAKRHPVELMLADMELASGSLESSARRYASLTRSPDREIKGRALMGLFHSRSAQGRAREAEDALDALRKDYPELARELTGS